MRSGAVIENRLTAAVDRCPLILLDPHHIRVSPPPFFRVCGLPLPNPPTDEHPASSNRKSAASNTRALIAREHQTHVRPSLTQRRCVSAKLQSVLPQSMAEKSIGSRVPSICLPHALPTSAQISDSERSCSSFFGWYITLCTSSWQSPLVLRPCFSLSLSCIASACPVRRKRTNDWTN